MVILTYYSYTDCYYGYIECYYGYIDCYYGYTDCYYVCFQGLPADLAMKLIDYLISEKLLKPKSLHPFVSW